MSADPRTAGELPGFIDPTETFRLASSDGADLYGEYFAVADPRGAALILHGYAEHCGRYREIAHVANRLGHAALAIDFRGHGRSSGQRGYINRFTDYLDDAEVAFAKLRRLAGDLPALIIAHSNGGLVTLRWLADPTRQPSGLYAAVISSPFLGFKLRVPAYKSLIGRVASRMAPTLSLPNELRVEQLTSDLERQNARRLDTLCHDVASARWFTEASATQRWVLSFAHRLAVPTLWLIATKDQLADAEAARAVHDRIRCASVYHELDMEHEVFNERERSVVIGLLREFVEAYFPS
jgi:alpha-beta hydrolase superfamily lysophospholipase